MPDTIDDVDEHPIIFNDWSIQRILAGEKTQTRRIVKSQTPDSFTPHPEYGAVGPFYHDGMQEPYGYGFCDQNGKEYECPYGQPGSRLWVGEAFRLAQTYDEMTPREYVDEGQPHIVRFEADEGDYNAVPKDGWGRKRPPIHMPKELCRLRVRVEDVRVERVQEISYEDVVAEGFEAHVDRERYGQKRTVKYPWSLMERDDLTDTGHSVQSYDYAFKKLWNDIHGDGAWERNDWVWVIEFARYDE